MKNNKKCLIVIPARGGSKGIPKKNIKLLAGKPLIYYSIDLARLINKDTDICVSTDDDEIINIVQDYGLDIPFKRPKNIANDSESTYSVLCHALNYYENLGKTYDAIIKLQPTSPFRRSIHLEEALKIFNNDVDMVVSVKETGSNPYYVLFEEDKNGFLHKSKNGKYTCRQSCPKVWEFNGSIYVINTNSLKQYSSFNEFNKIIKYTMNDFFSVDIDTPFDWVIAETLIKNKKIFFNI